MSHRTIRGRAVKHSPEHRAWSAMIQRCSNPKNPGFRNYGARGQAHLTATAGSAPIVIDPVVSFLVAR